MDVRSVLIITSVLSMMTACSKEKPAATVFNDNSLSSKLSDCDSLTVKNKFIVEWLDGHFSKEEGANKEEFLESFVQPNLSKIKLVEYDEVLQFKDSLGDRSDTTALPSNEWGQQAIQASGAWNENQKGQGVIVGVVDTQIDVTQPSIRNQILYNLAEIPGNGIDDDNNGYIDDYEGGLFTEACTPNQTTSDGCQLHATHVSGVIAGSHSISAPMRGIAPSSKIVQGAFLDHNGGGDLSGAVLGLQYVASRGARVINASWGSGTCGMSLKNQIENLTSKGIFIVAAAGNDGRDITNPTNRVYPAGFQFSNLIVVASGTVDNVMSSFSNNSYDFVHVAAPGSYILSSIPFNGVENYGSLSGTSMAAPFVTGALAVLIGARPMASPEQIKQALFEGVDANSPFLYRVSTKGRINLTKSLARLKQLVP